MSEETAAVETAPEAEPAAPYSPLRAVLGAVLLPLFVLILTALSVRIFFSSGNSVDQSVGFLLTSSSFLVATFLYLLVTGKIRDSWGFLKLRGFSWRYIPLGLAGAGATYAVATLVGMIASYLTQLKGSVEMGSNSTSQTIGDLSQSHSLVFLGFLIAILAPVAEEIFFRGALLGSLVQKSKQKWLRFGAVVFVSVIFGMFHFQGSITTMADLLAMVIPGLVGVTAAIFTLRYNSLYPAIFTHLFYNGFVLLILAGAAAS